MPTARTLLIELTIIVGLGLLLALLGPFGSFEAPLADRLLYWLGLGVGGYLLFRPMMTAASAVSRRLDLPEPATWAAGCLIATLPMSLVVWLITPTGGGRVPTLAELLPVYGNVAVVAAAVTLVFWFVSRPEREALRPAPAPSAPIGSTNGPEHMAPPRFFDRLPPHLGRELLALEMEDHYVRAHTTVGSELVLMRMRDAVAELEGVEGLQIHRSWWVAREAVERAVQDGRNLRLRLRNGLEAPVARNSVPALRAAGWLY
jgi:hypothetical protein